MVYNFNKFFREKKIFWSKIWKFEKILRGAPLVFGAKFFFSKTPTCYIFLKSPFLGHLENIKILKYLWGKKKFFSGKTEKRPISTNLDPVIPRYTRSEKSEVMFFRPFPTRWIRIRWKKKRKKIMQTFRLLQATCKTPVFLRLSVTYVKFDGESEFAKKIRSNR